MTTTNSNRFLALDVLRGLTIAGMILVNNPGNWQTTFSPLRHARWTGCTPADLVFPFFLFIVGAAMAFSFSKYNTTINKENTKKILFRGTIIFMIGLLLNAFPFYPFGANSNLSTIENFTNYYSNLRIFGVLQRIALCYVIGAFIVLWLKKSSKIMIAMVVLAFLHWILLALTGDWSAQLVNGAKGIYSLQGQGATLFDIAVIGENHIYKEYGIPFDPEGLLSTLTATCTLLLGYLIGQITRKEKSKDEITAELYTVGLLCVSAGIILSVLMPICKALWTSSYFLFAGGWSTIILALFIYFIDIKGKDKFFLPFKAMGLNPLFSYIVADLLAKIASIIKWKSEVIIDQAIIERQWSVSTWFYNNVCIPIAGGNENGVSSLLYSLTFLAIVLSLSLILYKKKIIIKL